MNKSGMFAIELCELLLRECVVVKFQLRDLCQ
jgi:hypothetical protein